MLIGLDLGNSFTNAAVWDGKLRMIEINKSGATSLPTVVCIANGEVLVGQDAVDAGRQHPDFDLRNFKPHFAERWHDQEDTGFQTCRGPDGMLAYRGPDDFIYSPVDLARFVIEEMVDAANAYLAPHDTVTGAVIGVPATFEPHQIAAVKEAARMAGLENVHTLEEPVAAAIANGVDAKKHKKIFVVDFGGSTLDTTIVSAGGGHIAILAKNGNGDLGGADFDRRIADYVINLFKSEQAARRREEGSENVESSDLKLRDAAMSRILVEAELAKKRLTDSPTTVFQVDNIDRTAKGVSLHMIYTLDTRILASICGDLIDRMLSALRATIDDARRKDPKFVMSDIHEIHLVGGMTRMPAVSEACREFFGKAPKKDESPERVVSQGLAIRAAIIEGRMPDPSMQDITSMPIALETRGNIPAIVIERGANFPMTKTIVLSNADDDQTELSLRLLYATRPRAQDCHVLDAIDHPIEPAPAETLRMKLVLSVDTEGHPSIVSIGA